MAIRLDAHRDEQHRDQQWHKPCRVATTANITISTALNNGDTLDGITLATGDRVLVKDQSTGSQNGIYIVGTSPARAYDWLAGIQAMGAFVYVMSGTANAGKLFHCTNITLPTIGTTSVVITEFSPGGFPTAADVTITDAGGYYTGTEVEAALQEIGADFAALGSGITDHEHINSIWFSGDGSTTAFELPAAPFDAYAVVAFVSGTQTDVTLSGTLLTTATFGSAPASGTDNIRVDIVAAIA